MSDESNVEYLLTNGLNDMLMQVLQANDPGRPFFSLKVDTVVNKTLNNLLNCGASAINLSESFIDGGSQWVLDRFAPRMAHNDLETRKAASHLMQSLLRIYSHNPEDCHRKVFLIQNYELIRTALSVLKNEHCERIVPLLLDIITLSVTKRIDLQNSDLAASLRDM